MSSRERFEIDYNPDKGIVAMLDRLNNETIVLDIDQVEELFDWYTKEFHKFVI